MKKFIPHEVPVLKPCIIASQKSWNSQLADRLTKRMNRDFITMQHQHELNAVELAKINPQCIFFPHWSHKIPQAIWQHHESIIFHMTDVPYGRGGSPLQNLIARGHKTTMLSALRCVEALDAGPVYMKKQLTLTGSAEEIFCRADQIIEEMIVDIITNQPIPQEQTGEPVFFTRRKMQDSNLAHSTSLEEVFNMIRMLDAEGYPHAFLEVGNVKYEFRSVKEGVNSLEARVVIQEIKKD